MSIGCSWKGFEGVLRAFKTLGERVLFEDAFEDTEDAFTQKRKADPVRGPP